MTDGVMTGFHDGVGLEGELVTTIGAAVVRGEDDSVGDFVEDLGNSAASSALIS